MTPDDAQVAERLARTAVTLRSLHCELTPLVVAKPPPPEIHTPGAKPGPRPPLNIQVVSIDDWATRTLRSAVELITADTGLHVPHTSGVDTCDWIISHTAKLVEASHSQPLLHLTDDAGARVMSVAVWLTDIMSKLCDVLDVVVTRHRSVEVDERWQSSSSCVRRLRAAGVNVDARRLRDWSRRGTVSSQVMLDGKRYYRFSELVQHVKTQPPCPPS